MRKPAAASPTHAVAGLRLKGGQRAPARRRATILLRGIGGGRGAIGAADRRQSGARSRRDRLDVDGSTEPASLPGNPFPLALSEPTSSPHAARIAATWSGALADGVEYTLAVAAGRAFADDAAPSGNVAWVAESSTRPQDFTSWSTHLASVGALTLDVFVLGTRGEGMGAEKEVGVRRHRWL